MATALLRSTHFAIALVTLALLACTSDKLEPPASDIAPETPAPTVTRPPISTASPAPAPGPWQVGEPIPLTLEPYPTATLTEVTTDTVLRPRDDLDRDGGAFLWERATDRLLFIEGVRHLNLAPELLDDRPLAIAHTDWNETDRRSLIVRLDPFEVVALPTSFNVVSDPTARWDDLTTARVSTWQSQTYERRTLPVGEYTLDLATATLTLISPQQRGSSSARVVEESWSAGPSKVVSLVLQDGRHSLNRGVGGAGTEVAGHIERWALSPDESKLLMIANHTLTLFYFDQDRVELLGGPADYGSVTWSPDGCHIAATVFDSFEDTTRALVFDVDSLDDIPSSDFLVSETRGLPLPPFDGYWTWLWRGPGELFVYYDSTLSLLDVETGDLTPVLTGRQPYSTLAWDPTSSTLAHSRIRGVPVSILDLDEGSAWLDITFLAASPHVGLFDMNWGAEGAWLALNTAPGRS